MEKPFNINLSETVICTICSENTGTLQKCLDKPVLLSINLGKKIIGPSTFYLLFTFKQRVRPDALLYFYYLQAEIARRIYKIAPKWCNKN